MNKNMNKFRRNFYSREFSKGYNHFLEVGHTFEDLKKVRIDFVLKYFNNDDSLEEIINTKKNISFQQEGNIYFLDFKSISEKSSKISIFSKLKFGTVSYTEYNKKPWIYEFHKGGSIFTISSLASANPQEKDKICDKIIELLPSNELFLKQLTRKIKEFQVIF